MTGQMLKTRITQVIERAKTKGDKAAWVDTELLKEFVVEYDHIRAEKKKWQHIAERRGEKIKNAIAMLGENS